MIRRAHFSPLLAGSLLVVTACGGTTDPDPECGGDEQALCVETGEGEGEGEGETVIEATESYERDVGNGWIAAGQPTEARLEEVVNAGARIISLRYENEETFDEQALVEGLGGTFIRYATQASSYDDVSFREGMYDLYDGEHAAGGPVYLHCASGNRVGASWALYHAERKGLGVEEAIQKGKDAGLGSLESNVRAILAE